MRAGAYEDAARFDPYEPGEVVAASFACPWCLTVPSTVVLGPDDVMPSAACRCRGCGRRWTVHLDARQAMRLALAPPPELPRPRR